MRERRSRCGIQMVHALRWTASRPYVKMRGMKLAELLQTYSRFLADEGQTASAREADTPIATPRGRQVSIVGTLFLYRFDLPAGATLPEDLPVSIVPGDTVTVELSPLDLARGRITHRMR